MVQAFGGAVMVYGGYFLDIHWALLYYMIIIHLNTDHLHPFMTTVYPSSDGTKLKSSPSGFFDMTINSLRKCQMSPHVNSTVHLSDLVNGRFTS